MKGRPRLFQETFKNGVLVHSCTFHKLWYYFELVVLSKKEAAGPFYGLWLNKKQGPHIKKRIELTNKEQRNDRIRYCSWGTIGQTVGLLQWGILCFWFQFSL